MDNRLFNVNGRTKEQLTLAVKTLLLDEYGKQQKVKGWYFSENSGLVLTWSVGDSQQKAIPFTNRMGQPEEIGEEELVNLLWEWLKSDEADKVKLGDWEGDLDHDGSNDTGWRLYVDQWGHVKETKHTIDHYSIAAFKKVYLWYGK